MSATANNTLQKKKLSENLHATGKWRTTISSTGNPFIRWLWDFYSYKRKGISNLAAQSTNAKHVLDLGAGNGAYSQWFLGKKSPVTITAVDWSFTGLQKITSSPKGSCNRVCADIHYLPFKSQTFDTLFSIDTLGHVSHIDRVLDEILRVTKGGARLFLHSECSDYQYRWPDNYLIRKNNRDVLAQQDGHFSLKTSATIHSLYQQRFHIRSFFSPAGIVGWLIGYPEKYRSGFKQAHYHLFTGVTTLFAIIKKIPVLGAVLRLLNACTNHLELFFGLYGGGSCFSFLEKPHFTHGEKT